ncbi:MAG: hypothetical protein JRG96_13640 [Deltaproteobacteria bacterium]|nr:hypothetical protein [Deltaproteobacteria bacterium]MBW2417589.1 hypothetical protein [Deltaproteobacteria bacterium]
MSGLRARFCENKSRENESRENERPADATQQGHRREEGPRRDRPSMRGAATRRWSVLRAALALLAALCGAGQAARADESEDRGWPREIVHPTATIVVYRAGNRASHRNNMYRDRKGVKTTQRDRAGDRARASQGKGAGGKGDRAAAAKDHGGGRR